MLLLFLLQHAFFTHYLSPNYHVAWPWGQRHSQHEVAKYKNTQKQTNRGNSPGGQLGGSAIKKTRRRDKTSLN